MLSFEGRARRVREVGDAVSARRSRGPSRLPVGSHQHRLRTRWASAAQHAKNQKIVAIDPVRDHAVSDCESANTWPQVFVAAAADVRLVAQEYEASSDRVD